MACQIVYDKQGKIKLVLDKQKRESKIYNQLKSHPMIDDPLTAYTNFPEDIKDESAYNVIHKVGDKFYNSYKEALKATNENGKIEIVFQGEGQTKVLSTITKSTDVETKDGFINFYIENNLIADKRKNGKLTGQGISNKERLFNALEIQRLAVSTLGVDSFNLDYYSFEISEPTLGKTKLTLKNGEEVFVSPEEITNINDFRNPEEANIVKNYKEPVYRDLPKPQSQSEESLQLKLMDVLNNLGVSVMSITDYTKRYRIKNGVNPSARALADIANGVIALEEGVATIEDFIEEVAHFIESATSAEKKENILRNIHKTKEYIEHAEAYRTIYSEDYSGEELENIVRREVLGKVIKNSIQENEQRNETERNILQRAFDLIVDFVNSITSNNELKIYLNDINDAIEQNTSGLIDRKNINSIYTFYSTAKSPITKEVLRIIGHLNNVRTNLPKTDIASIVKIEQQINTSEEVYSVVALLDVINHAVKKLQNALKDSEVNNKDYAFTLEETSLYFETLNIAESLPRIAEALRSQPFEIGKKDLKEATISRLQEVKQNLDTLKAQKESIVNTTTKRIVDELMRDSNNQQSREYYEEAIIRAKNDATILSSTFGTLANSTDGMLNIIGKLLVSMTGQAHRNMYNDYQDYVNQMESLGFKAKDVAEFLDGNYMISEFNLTEFDNDNDKDFIPAYREITQDSEITDEEIIKQKNSNSLKIDSDIFQQVSARAMELSDVRVEKSRKPEFYEKIEQRYQNAGIEKDSPTRAYLSVFLSEVSKFKNKATDENGKTDYTKLSLQEYETLKQLQQDRKLKKDYFDITSGELKKGLEYKGLDEKGKPIYTLADTNVSDEARIAFELNKLDALTLEELKQGGDRDNTKALRDFKDSLKGLSREAQVRFIEVNATLGFTEAYYEAIQAKVLNEDGSVSDKPSILSQMLEQGKDEQAKRLAEINSQINTLLKAYTSKTNPTEIVADDIPETTKELIRQLHSERTAIIQDFSGETFETERQIDLITDTNESFNKELDKYENYKDKLQFIMDNTTDADAMLIRKMEVYFDEFLKGNRTKPPKSLERFYSGQETKEKVILEYAKTKVLPYYKRTASDEYFEIVNRLKNSSEDINKIIDDINNSEFLKLQPNPSFFTKEEDDSLNPNYRPNLRTGWRQPKASLYRNADFFKLFGEGTKTDDKGFIIVETASNKKKAEFYNATLAFRFKTLDYMDVSKGYNYYTAPQIRAKGVERWAKIFNVDNLKGAVKDLTTFTEDDMILGDNSLGTDIRIIPKMYTRKLDDPEDMSKNLFTSMMMQHNEATLRDSRVKYLGQINSVMETIQTREQFKGKPAETTNAYKQAKSAVDYAVFGKQQEFTMPVKTALGEFDAVKVLQGFSSLIRFKNLGGSVVIPLTSAMSAKVVQQIERVVGQYYESNTYNLATKDFLKHVAKGTSEAGKINQSAYINVAGRYFGSFDMEEGIKNSNYSPFLKNLPRSTMALYSASMYGLFGKNLFYTFKNTRVVDGGVTTYQKFRANNIALKESEIKQKWKQYENATIDNYFEVKDGKIVWNTEKLGKDVVDFNIEDIENSIRAQVKNLNIRVDNQLSKEDKVLAQRHGLLNLLMIHRGWLVAATENRFKGMHHNTQTDMWEEGSYRSFYNYLGGVIKEWRRNGHSVVKAFKTEWDNAGKLDNPELTYLRRSNLKRVGIEFAVLNTLALVSLVIQGYADDDENKDLYALQMTNLLLYRTALESNSASFGIGSSYSSVIDDPLLAWQTAKDLSKVTDIFDSGEISTGAWSGYTKGEQFLFKNTPLLKQYKDMSNPYEKFNSTKYFSEVRNNQMATVPLYNFLNKEE